jgi:hypothetical protein
MTTVTQQESIHINKFNTLKSLISNGRYNVLSVNIPGGMILRDCECAVAALNLYNSIFNVTTALGDNQISVMYNLSGVKAIAVYN